MYVEMFLLCVQNNCAHKISAVDSSQFYPYVWKLIWNILNWQARARNRYLA